MSRYVLRVGTAVAFTCLAHCGSEEPGGQPPAPDASTPGTGSGLSDRDSGAPGQDDGGSSGEGDAGAGSGDGGFALRACGLEASDAVYDAPLVITQGGTYSGNWRSTDSALAAVTVQTSEPVVIENARIESAGTLIQARHPGLHLTVRNVWGHALVPTVATQKMGRFLNAELVRRVDVQSSCMVQTSGIYVAQYEGNHTPEETIMIQRNQARNIDGRKPDGSHEFVQFVQFNGVHAVAGVDIAWNEVINEPDNSAVEDNINLFQSNGTAASPIRIHDNYIQGAYLPDAEGSGYSGGGILAGDGSPTRIEDSPGHVEVFANQVVNVTNYGIAVAAGHDISVHDNRVVHSGVRQDDGTYLPSSNVGLYVWNVKDGVLETPVFFNNRAFRNTSGYTNRAEEYSDERNDWWFPHCAFCPDEGADANVRLPGPLTTDTERDELEAWHAKLASQGVIVGRP